jgi:16S rRNA (adenine1518-N6/adenine1519-N6)-dimethyltransferase
MLQYHFNMRHVFDVAPQSFSPAPQVDSAIVEMIPCPQTQKIARDEVLLSQIVLAAFSQRRKTLKNTLQHYLTIEDFYTLNIDSGLRAENLSMQDFVIITNFYDAKSGE